MKEFKRCLRSRDPGTPKGSVSIVAKIKATFGEALSTSKHRSASSSKIPFNRNAVTEQIDGKSTGVCGSVLTQLAGIKSITTGSTPVPTKSALRRQMLPTPNLTIEGWRHVADLENLKTQCAFKLAELVETPRVAIEPVGVQDEISEKFSQIKQRDMDKQGKLKIVPKDEVRKAPARSPRHRRHCRAYVLRAVERCGGWHLREQCRQSITRTFSEPLSSVGI